MSGLAGLALVAGVTSGCTTITTVQTADAGAKAPDAGVDPATEGPDAGAVAEPSNGTTDTDVTTDAGVAADAAEKMKPTILSMSGWLLNDTCDIGCGKMGYTCASACMGPKSPAVAGTARWAEDSLQGETLEIAACSAHVPVPDFKPPSSRLQDVACCCLAPTIQSIHSAATDLKSCDDVCAAKGLTCSDIRGPQRKGAVFEFSGNCDKSEACNVVPMPTGTCVGKERPLTDVTCTCL